MTDRIWLKILSVLLGIFAWIYVNLVIPPQIRRTLEAEVEYRNMPENVKITPARPTVGVQIEGSRRDFILSSSTRLQVVVDLYNVRPGRAQLPVRVTSSSGLSVISVNPPQIQIEAAPIVKKKYEVKPEIIGQPADGYLAEEPRFSPDKVTLEGPETLIDRVTSCVVDINLDQVKNSISEQRQVKVVLESGVTNEEIIVAPPRVNVDVTVKQGFPSRSVPLAKPVFINKPPEGKKLDGFKVTPDSVLITGPSRIIGPLHDISFRPIDLSKVEKSGSMAVKLEMPGEKVRLISSEAVSIEVTLVDTKVSKVFPGLPFELKKSSSQHTTVSVASYSIEVEGYLKDLDKVRNAQLQMVLDVEKMKPGSYSVNLTAPTGLPENVAVLRILPEALHIQITELDESAGPRPEPKTASESSQP